MQSTWVSESPMKSSAIRVFIFMFKSRLLWGPVARDPFSLLVLLVLLGRSVIMLWLQQVVSPRENICLHFSTVAWTCLQVEGKDNVVGCLIVPAIPALGDEYVLLQYVYLNLRLKSFSQGESKGPYWVSGSSYRAGEWTLGLFLKWSV